MHISSMNGNQHTQGKKVPSFGMIYDGVSNRENITFLLRKNTTLLVINKSKKNMKMAAVLEANYLETLLDTPITGTNFGKWNLRFGTFFVNDFGKNFGNLYCWTVQIFFDFHAFPVLRHVQLRRDPLRQQFPDLSGLL